MLSQASPRMWKSSLPVLCINLERQPERMAATISLCQTVGFGTPLFIRGVDGHELAAAGGRARKVGPGTFRLSYDSNDPEGGRIFRIVKANKLGDSGASDVWAQHGCSMSHRLVLEKVRNLLETNPAVLVLEDDCVPGRAVTDPAAISSVLSNKSWSLSECHPEWVCILLGAVAMFSHVYDNGPTSVEGLSHGGYLMQAHACLWRQTDETSAILQDVLDKLDSGLISGPDMFFFCCSVHLCVCQKELTKPSLFFSAKAIGVGVPIRVPLKEFQGYLVRDEGADRRFIYYPSNNITKYTDSDEVDG